MHALTRDPETWQAADALAVVKYTREYHLHRFFQEWWNASPQYKIGVAYAAQRFLAAARHRNSFAVLGIQSDDETFWRKIAALPSESRPTSFPGIDALIAQHEASQAGDVRVRSGGGGLLLRPDAEPRSSRPGDPVRHSHYGPGVITRVDEDGLLTVKFETWGEKKMRWSGSDLVKA
jgi:DNA helicase-2/ATP-dependent DNA helicase PcrA